MKPAVEIAGARVFLGDCRDVLRTLPDNSVDSIVTDPPYELGFMGKSWDNSGVAYDVTVWQECLRVLKPGGHVLAFGGSRTWHRLAVAVEDAGFELRDSIAWLYGSGFPKSLDVSKAIDKGQGLNTERRFEFTAWMKSTGITARQIDDITGTKMGSHYTTHPTQPAIATADLFDKLRPYLPEVPEAIERLVAERTGIEWTAYKQREVIGQKMSGIADKNEKGRHTIGASKAVEVDITAPSTPEAKAWQGWGTALKPAFEPVVVGRKPLGAETAVRAIIENELNKRGETEIRWTRLASDAIRQSPSKHSGSTKAPKTAETFAKTASELEMQSTGETILNSIEQAQEGLRSETQADSESLQEKPKQTLGSKSLTTTETSVPVVEKAPDSSLRSTTLKVEEIDTESALTGMSGQSLGETGSLTVIESFAGIATGLPGGNASVLINKLSDGSFEWPDGLPEVFKTGNTVAENVLAWGVGGLNIDGSRIGAQGNTKIAEDDIAISRESKSVNAYGNGIQGPFGKPVEGLGRWPANVILDEVSARLVDEQSGVSVSKASAGRNGNNAQGVTGMIAPRLRDDVRGHSDSGGASRFFYQAKASKRDRNEGLEDLEAIRHADRVVDDGPGGENLRNRTNQAKQNFHPTVKPTQLMRYLIKLVTPAGGVVLDPFTGSGSTGKAALLDGYQFIGAELTEEYLPIIEGRLRWAAEQEGEDDDTLF